MGFCVFGYLVFETEAIALYNRLLPGAAAYVQAVPVKGPGPKAWLLPRPSCFWPILEKLGQEEAIEKLIDVFDEWTDQETCLGIDQIDFKLPCGDGFDWGLAALMSMVSPAGVVELGDDTHAGLVVQEYATAWQDGRCVAAAGSGMNYPQYLFSRSGHPLQPQGDETEVAWCAAHLHTEFRSFFLYDGYLPRSINEEPNLNAPRPLPQIDGLMPWERLKDWPAEIVTLLKASPNEVEEAASTQAPLSLYWYQDYEWEERQKTRDRFRNWTAKFEQTLQPDYEPPTWHEPLSEADNQAILAMARQIDEILAAPSPNPETIQQIHRELKWHQHDRGSLWRSFCDDFIRWNWLVNRRSNFVGVDHRGSIFIATWGIATWGIATWGDQTGDKPQRQTIEQAVTTEFEFKRYTSCLFQYAKVKLKIEPWDAWDSEVCEQGVQVNWQMPDCTKTPSDQEMGETIPARFLPTILDGIEDALLQDAKAGISLVRCKITILGGRYHPADSNDTAYRIAAHGSLKRALDQAELKILA